MDETQSQDVAFTLNDKQEDVFKFDAEVNTQEETPADSQSEKETKDTDSDSRENKDEEEKRVPYSRFKSKIEELEQTRNTIQALEERLASLENSRVESKTSEEDINVPSEWVELYGDSDVSKRAYKIQLQREEQLQENAVQRAISQLKAEAQNESKQLVENEQIIEDNLEILQETLGKKITPKMEEDILSIVDEFSPVGTDGKYISLFPFDKAYEIYELRNAKNGLKTRQARSQVAELTSNTSNEESDSSGSSFKRGWDNWREAL